MRDEERRHIKSFCESLVNSHIGEEDHGGFDFARWLYLSIVSGYPTFGAAIFDKYLKGNAKERAALIGRLKRQAEEAALRNAPATYAAELEKQQARVRRWEAGFERS